MPAYDRIAIENTDHLTKGSTGIRAYVGSQQIASLILYPTGEIAWVGVRKAYRRQGIARALFRHALAAGYRPRHSPCRSPEGDAWARSVGGILPPLHSLPCATCAEEPHA